MSKVIKTGAQKKGRSPREMTIEEVATLFPFKHPAVICASGGDNDEGKRYVAFWAAAFLDPEGKYLSTLRAPRREEDTHVAASSGAALAALVKAELAQLRSNADQAMARAREEQARLEEVEARLS